MKSVRIWSYSGPRFPALGLNTERYSRIRTKYREKLRIFPYSVQMRENADQSNLEYVHFSRSELQSHFTRH